MPKYMAAKFRIQFDCAEATLGDMVLPDESAFKGEGDNQFPPQLSS